MLWARAATTPLRRPPDMVCLSISASEGPGDMAPRIQIVTTASQVVSVMYALLNAVMEDRPRLAGASLSFASGRQLQITLPVCPQCIGQLAVPSVDVVAKLVTTGLIHPYRPVQQVYGYGGVQHHVHRAGLSECFVEGRRAPVAVILQQFLRQFERALYTDASGTELAVRPSEQVLPRCIVQVHIILIREHEFYLTNGVPGTGLLH